MSVPYSLKHPAIFQGMVWKLHPSKHQKHWNCPSDNPKVTSTGLLSAECSIQELWPAYLYLSNTVLTIPPEFIPLREGAKVQSYLQEMC